jgi:hypothetical protein
MRQAAGVCRSLRAVADHSVLWGALLQRDFERVDGPPPLVDGNRNNMPQQPTPKSLYAEQFKAVQARQLQMRRRRTKRLCEASFRGFFRALPLLTMVLLILSTVLFFYAVDERGGISLPDAFAPLFVLYGLWFTAVVGTICNHSLRKLWCCEDIRGDEGFLPRAIHEMVGDRLRSKTLMFALLASLLVFLTLLAVKLGGATDASFATVFIPLWLSFFCFCISPVFGWLRSSSDRFALFGLAWFIFLPLLIFVAVLNSRLDGGSVPVHLAAIPLWIVLGLVLMVPFTACTIAVISARFRVGPWDCRPRDAWQYFIACTGNCAFIAPLVVFLILVSLNDAGEAPQTKSTVLIPLLLWESIIAAAALANCVS